MGESMPVRITYRHGGESTADLPAPLWTDSGAVFEYSAAMEYRFTKQTKYDKTLVFIGRIFYQNGTRYLAVPRETEGVKLGKEDRRVEGLACSFESHFTPRDERQATAVSKATALLKKGRSFILQAPTGEGKTVMGCALAAEVGRKTLVIVRKEDLRDQWYKAARDVLGLSADQVGLIQGKTFNIEGKSFVIAMVQTLARPGKFTMEQFNDFGFIIADEVHSIGADYFSSAMWLLAGKLRLGLSATPTRKDGRDVVVFGHIGPIEVKINAMRITPKVVLVETGWQVPRTRKKTQTGGYRLVQIPHSPGRINHINKILSRSDARNALIASFVKQARDNDRSVLVLSELREHLDAIGVELRKAGVPTRDVGYYVGGLTKEERAEAQHKPVILGTYSYTAEGTNIPWLDTLVLATPRADVVQIVGRILREYEGKRQPVVMDLADRDSPVFNGYAQARVSWYHSIGAEVKFRSALSQT